MSRVRKGWSFAILGTLLWGCGGGGGLSDMTPPRIERVEITPSSLIQPKTNVTVRATVTDEESGIRQVQVSITFPDGKTHQGTMNRETESVYSITFMANWDEGAVSPDPESWFITVTIEAVNGKGLKAQSTERIRVIPFGPPPPPPFD